MASSWLLCSYQLPREPSRLRLGVWRRLRRLGALMPHDGLWVLPADAAHRESLEWLAGDIEEMGGSVLTWESRTLDPAQDAELCRQFRAAAEERYAEVGRTAAQLARVARRRGAGSGAAENARKRLGALERGLRLDRRRDFFRAPGHAEARKAIEDAVRVLTPEPVSTTKPRRQRAVGHQA